MSLMVSCGTLVISRLSPPDEQNPGDETVSG